jgi:hypothetical protein
VKNIDSILKDAFSHAIAVSLFQNDNWDKVPNDIIRHFSNKINPNAILDKELIKIKDLHDHINWDIIDRKKAIRVLARDIDLLNRIDIKKLNYKPSELYPLFLQYPELIPQLIDDFDKLTPLEAIQILECNNDLVDIINISKYNFNKRDMLEIIKKFRKSEPIMERLDLSVLDHYTTRRLICQTGDDYIDKLNLKSLKPADWLEILEQHPDLLEFCDISIFESGDCYMLTKLVIKFPELDYLIEKNADKISALGWENLVREDLDKYQDLCKWEKLSESNWVKVLRKYPHLDALKQQYFLF